MPLNCPNLQLSPCRLKQDLNASDGAEQEARGRGAEASPRPGGGGHPAGGHHAQPQEKTPGRHLRNVGADRAAQQAEGKVRELNSLEILVDFLTFYSQYVTC